LTVRANGTFNFLNSLPILGAFSVTVASHPASQACSVFNGSANNVSSNVTNIAINCVSIPQGVTYVYSGPPFYWNSNYPGATHVTATLVLNSVPTPGTRVRLTDLVISFEISDGVMTLSSEIGSSAGLSYIRTDATGRLDEWWLAISSTTGQFKKANGDIAYPTITSSGPNGSDTSCTGPICSTGYPPGGYASTYPGLNSYGWTRAY
jgi:hypothetical protein